MALPSTTQAKPFVEGVKRGKRELEGEEERNDKVS
jgi:hypothetical protein